MEKTLLIVESPAKARTIGRYLGPNYAIRASVGHVRDLPVSTLGVSVKDNYKPMYITMAGKEKVIRDLKEAAKSADRILLATDPDREGEAIAFHLAHILKLDPADKSRVTFNEITERAVKQAVEKPRVIDMDLVNAQQSRRILDRLVGYELSPLLWKKIKKGLSAGRVQSVATRLLVVREREIRAFVPEEYWLLHAHLDKETPTRVFRVRYHGERSGSRTRVVVPKSKEETDALLLDLKDATYTVHSLKPRVLKRQPWAPFTTSSLQQEASKVLSFNASRTMRIAQQLYEGVTLPGLGPTALITYMRTDSVRVSQVAIEEARRFVVKAFGEEYIAPKPRLYKNRSVAQNAHEAIRPTHFDLAPISLKGKLTDEQYRLYKLIWDRFLASQMAAAEFDSITVDVLARSHLFRAKGETLRFAGFLALWGHKTGEESEDDQSLPPLTEGETLVLKKLVPEQKFTQPPARYTEASLIKTLEEYGIGRPSTYAPTIGTILDRKYAERVTGRTLKATELGEIVTEMLEQHFDRIVDPEFTAQMESELDTVEAGERDWVDVIDGFYPDFHKQVEAAEETIEKVELPVIPTGEKCPDCKEGDLLIKEGRYGKFIACSRYPDCHYSAAIEEKAGMACPLCASDVLIKKARSGRRKFFVCDRRGQDPECPFISWYKPLTGQNCATCGSYLVETRYRGKAGSRCSNSDCPTNARRSKKSADKKADSDA